MAHIIDESSCKMRCCNKCDMYRKELQHYKNLAEKGLLVEIKCHCKDCVHIDYSGCAENTMYCEKHGCYMSGYDGFCAEAEQALKD